MAKLVELEPKEELNDLILDRYKILEELASTAFSTVFKAFDTKMQRPVAIKMIESSSKATTWAKREAQLSAQLNHPNICTIFEYEETDKAHFLIMEYLEGQTLREVLDSCGVLPAEEAMAVFKEVSLALEYAHLNYIIHKDVKPENILLLKDGRLKIMDFGTARLLSQTKKAQKSLIGTPAYMSPEQLKKGHIDDRSDQFSLAVLAYEMLSGASPFEASTTAASIFKVQNSKVKSLAEFNEEISEDFAQIVNRGLSKKPDGRFETVTDFRYKLERACPPVASSQKILGNLVERSQNLTSSRPREDGRSLLDGFRHLTGLIYNKNKKLVNRIFMAGLISALGYVLFNSIAQSYSFLVMAILAALTAFFPSVGITGLAFLSSIVLFMVSKPLLALIVLGLGIGWYFVGRKASFEIGFASAAPLLAFLRLPVLFPIFSGLAFAPIKAFLVSLGGALMVLVFSAVWQRQTGWLAGPVELSQLLSWPMVSFCIGLFTKSGNFSRAVLVCLAAFVILTASYLIIGSLGQIEVEQALKSVSLSLIITMVILPLLPFSHQNDG